MRKKTWVLLAFLLWLSVFAGEAAPFKLELSPYARYKLSKLPLVGRFVKPPEPPKKEYAEAQKVMDELALQGAPTYLRSRYERLLKKWERAKKFYSEGHYDWAKQYFEEIVKTGKKTLEEVKKIRKLRKEAALKELDKVKKVYEKKKDSYDPERRLRIELGFWKLETLVEMEKFQRFSVELKRFRDAYGL